MSGQTGPWLIDLITRVRYDAIVRAHHFSRRPPDLRQSQAEWHSPCRSPWASRRHNLAKRLEDHQEAVLRFLTNPDVPFTNNQAERDGRMMKPVEKSPAASAHSTVQRISR